MISALVSFQELLETVKDDTGLSNLRSQYERISRFIARATEDLGYSGAQVFKKVPYVNDGTNFDGKRIWMPLDWIEFYGIKDQDGEVLKENYIVQGNFLHFCDGKTRDKAELYYYGMMADGFGYPCVTRNQKEALSAYIIWKLMASKAFLQASHTSLSLADRYEQKWKDLRDAAIGNEVWPTNEQEWAQIANTLKFSTKDAIIYYVYNDLESACALEAKTKCVLREVQKMITVYHWQYADRVSNIDLAPAVSQGFLDDETTKQSLETFMEGLTIPYANIGRIGFAVQGGSARDYDIYDLLNSNITEIVFDTYYNSTLKLDIYISKEFYSHSNMFFKLKENI